MNPEQAMARLGGRRYLLTVVSLFVYAALLVGGHIDQSTYLNLQLATVGAFIAGGAHQRYVEKKYANGSELGT